MDNLLVYFVCAAIMFPHGFIGCFYIQDVSGGSFCLPTFYTQVKSTINDKQIILWSIYTWHFAIDYLANVI